MERITPDEELDYIPVRYIKTKSGGILLVSCLWAVLGEIHFSFPYSPVDHDNIIGRIIKTQITVKIETHEAKHQFGKGSWIWTWSWHCQCECLVRFWIIVGRYYLVFDISTILDYIGKDYSDGVNNWLINMPVNKGKPTPDGGSRDAKPGALGVGAGGMKVSHIAEFESLFTIDKELGKWVWPLFFVLLFAVRNETLLF